MDISKCEFYTETDLIKVLRATTLVGAPGVKPFAGTDISISRVKMSDIIPTKKYVTQEKIDTINNLYTTFNACGLDLFNNWGFIIYAVPESPEKFVFTMPIVEIVHGYPLLTVGHHQVIYAEKRPFIAAVVNTTTEPYQSIKIRKMCKWNDINILSDKDQKKMYEQKDNASIYSHKNFPFPGKMSIPCAQKPVKSR